MNKFVTAALLLCTIFYNAKVEANGYSEQLTNRFNVSASFGLAEHTLDDDDVDELDKNTTSFGINFDYQLTQMISIGMGYVDFGEAEIYSETEVSNGNADKVTFDTAGKGTTLSVMLKTNSGVEEWGGFVRAGYIKWDVDFTYEFDFESQNFYDRTTLSDSAISLFGGLGLTYQLSEDLRLNFTADWYTMDLKFMEEGNTISFDQQFSVYALGLTYSF